MLQKLISIIIPIYNVEDYIRECLDSVISQSYQNLEIICVDDCGTDNSMNIVEAYANKDCRIKIIRNEINKGLPQARNSGMDFAKGEYLFFLDSDDYLKSNIIEKMYEKICQTNSDIVVSTIGSFYLGEDKDLLKKAEKSNIVCKNRDNYKVSLENLEESFILIPCLAWGKLFSTDFIKKNNIKFIEENVKFEDNGFYLKFLANFPRVSFIDDVGVCYRIRENSITAEMAYRNRKQLKFKNIKRVLEESFDYINSILSADERKMFYQSLKNSELYPWYFRTKWDKFINYKWAQNNKRVELLKIPVLREKVRGKKKILSVLGIPIRIKNI